MFDFSVQIEMASPDPQQQVSTLPSVFRQLLDEAGLTARTDVILKTEVPTVH